MSAPTARRVIPGIVTLGLAAGVVLVPNAAFAACKSGDSQTRPAAASQGQGHGPSVPGPSAGVTTQIAIPAPDETAVVVEPELPRQLSPELLNFIPESERPAVVVPPRLEQGAPSSQPVVAEETVVPEKLVQGTPEPQPAVAAEVERQVRPERLALLGSVPEPLPVAATETAVPPRLEQGTPEPLPVATTETVVPPRLEQGTPEPVVVAEVERQVRPERLALLGSVPEPLPVAATATVVPPRLEQGTPEPLPVVAEEALVPQIAEQGVPTPLPVETPSVVDQQIPIPATTTAGATVVDTDVDDTLATDEVADAPQSEAVAEGARLAADAPATTLSHTGVDGSTLALGGAGLGAILLGGAMLAIRRVRG